MAAGIVPAAHGNDIGGSLRIPASCCGVFGFKPSRGRLPMGPLRLELPGDMATQGFITRSVRDNAGLLDATIGADPPRPGDPAPPATTLRHVPPRGTRRRCGSPGSTVQSGAGPSIRIAKTPRPMPPALLRSLGHTVIEADLLDAAAHRAAIRAFLVLLSALVRHLTLGAEAVTGQPPRRSAFEPATWALGLIDSTHPPGAHAAALATQAA